MFAMGLRGIWRDLRQHELSPRVVRNAHAEEKRQLESLTDDERAQLCKHSAGRHELGFPAFMLERRPDEDD